MYLEADDYITLGEDAECAFCEGLMLAGEDAPVYDGHVFDSLNCRRAFAEEKTGGL